MIADTPSAQSARRPGKSRPTASAWITTPLILVLFSAVFIALCSSLISWALGAGTQGTFVVRLKDCDKGCAWFGEFVSSDHRVVVPHIQYVTSGSLPRFKPGEVVPAVDVRSALFGNAAYPARAALRDALWPSILPFEAVALVIVLVFVRWIWVVPVRYLRTAGYRAAGY